ncbi:MAG: FMN-binding protein [Parcubacteria group bacterium]|nr:FMN-binding protein [Parcubacteria group bacterium]
MKKIIASFVFVAGFIGYAAYANANSSASAQIVAVQTSPAATGTGTNPLSIAAPLAPTAPVAVTKPAAAAGTYTDGTYTGSVADAYYGNIQVKATISGGKLTDVTFLQYPNDRRESVSINQQAMPILRSEAIKAQSARVNGVSGASDTSAAFKISLASALAKA